MTVEFVFPFGIDFGRTVEMRYIFWDLISNIVYGDGAKHIFHEIIYKCIDILLECVFLDKLLIFMYVKVLTESCSCTLLITVRHYCFRNIVFESMTILRDGTYAHVWYPHNTKTNYDRKTKFGSLNQHAIWMCYSKFFAEIRLIVCVEGFTKRFK